MFNYISGRLVAKDPTFAVIDANGVGYELKISLNTYAKLQVSEPAKLFCYLYVKEDVQVLYGFWEQIEKRLFLQLISVSGIGPSTGMVMLSSLSGQEIKEAIVAADVRTIQSVKGIGAKTAQRVILELQDKLAKEGVSAGEGGLDVSSLSASANNQSEALEALVQLGIPKATADRNIRTIIKKNGHDLSVEQIIKMALRQ
ncbi:MAG: Holliday junction DNA helicase RuvA [Flammeovirgaceae bacterium]|jgi:Holliday junction DNA helicase RuvA